MRAEAFNEIKETLEKITNAGSYVLFFQFGELNADIMTRNGLLPIKRKDFKTLVSKGIAVGEELNWYIINSYHIDKNGAKLTAKSTFESRYHKKTKKCICFFIKGYLNKLANSTDDKKNYLCTETKCTAKGDDFCVFEIKKAGK